MQAYITQYKWGGQCLWEGQTLRNMHKQYECAIIKRAIYLHVEIQCFTLHNKNPAYSVTEDSRWTTAAKCTESELSSFLISVLRPIPGAPAGGRGYRGTDVILNANRKRLHSVQSYSPQ